MLTSIGNQFQTAATSGPLLLGLAASMLAGLVSFASPCVVPLVPGYLSYLAGIAGSDQAVASGSGAVRVPVRGRVVGAAALFVAGFTTIFVLASASVFGLIGVLALNSTALQRIGGAVTIAMGLAFIGLIPLLQRDTRPRPMLLSHIGGAPMLGAVFGLGWTPCLGPTLTGVISVAAGTTGMTAARGVVLIIAYCLGLGLPFIFLAYGSSWAMGAMGWLRRHSRHIQVVGGITMVAVGIALVTGQWAVFVSWLRSEFVSNVVLPV